MADRLEIVDALESLAVHCRPPLMDIDARSRWMMTWCEDLAEFPMEAVHAACKRWRQGDSSKFPTPGQLLPLVRGAIARPIEQTNKIWTWPSEDELAAMTLTERIRQNVIMASESRARIGPMQDDGSRAHPEWIERARNYDNEVIRLRKMLKASSQQIAAE